MSIHKKDKLPKLLMVFIKNFIIISSLLLNYKFIHPNDSVINKNNVIYTFWEPKEKIPGYIRLCIKTWKKYLPEYKVNILDYRKSKKLIEEPVFSNIVCKKMEMKIQTDAIRVAILKKFGGIWIDADTIILNDKIIKLFQNYDLSMIWEENLKFHYIALIYASKNSSIIYEWQQNIINKVKKYNDFLLNKLNISNYENISLRMNTYDYLGNSIIDPIIEKITNNNNKNFFHINSYTAKVLPEFFLFKNQSMAKDVKYQSLYFRKGDPQIVLNYSNSIIFLHNSWTPLEYKKMSEKKFIKQDILISKLFQKILEIKV